MFINSKKSDILIYIINKTFPNYHKLFLGVQQLQKQKYHRNPQNSEE